MPEDKASAEKPTEVQEPPASGDPASGSGGMMANHKELKLKPPTLTSDDAQTKQEAPKPSSPKPDEELQPIAGDKVVQTNNSQEDIAAKLVAEKTYVLPISSTPGRRLLGILVIVAIVGIIVCSIFVYWFLNK